MKAREGRRRQVARLHEDGNHANFVGPVTLQGAGHLHRVVLVRGDIIRTDQQQDDLCRIKVSPEVVSPLITSMGTAVVPAFDNSLALEEGEMLLQLQGELFISHRVAEEQLDRPLGRGLVFAGRRVD